MIVVPAVIPRQLCCEEPLFFKGKDFPGRPFKALMPEFYPLEYQKYITEETSLLKEKLFGQKRVLEGGVGIGRTIPIISPVVGELVCIDQSDLMVKESQKIAKKFPNTKVVLGKLEELDKVFPLEYFDSSVCVWNTLGNVSDEVYILKRLKRVTKGSIFVSVFKRGTIENRKKWYKTVGIELDRVVMPEETVYTKSGLKSCSYNLEDLQTFAQKANLKIKECRDLNGLVIWVEFV